MTHRIVRSAVRAILFAGALLAGNGSTWAHDDDEAPARVLPDGQKITPTAIPDSTFAPLSPYFPEYTPAVPNYPAFHPNGAIASTLSPDGTTLAVMTSGYNVLDDKNAKLVGNGAEFIILYDVTRPDHPVMKQTLRPPNTFVGLAFAPSGKSLYVSGGADDQVIVYGLAGGSFSQTATIDLGHGGYAGLGPKGTPGGIGVGQYPQTGGLSVSKDGSLLAVANSLNNSVSLIDTKTSKVLFEYDLRPFNTTPGSDGVAGGETLYSVAFKSNTTIYATSVRDRQVVAIDITPGLKGGTPQLLARIELPGSPNNLLLDRTQARLYVAQDNSDTVAVIDTSSNTVIEEIDAIAPPGLLADRRNRYTGAATNNIALAPDGRTLFITNGGANDVAIVPLGDDDTHHVAGLVPTGWYPTTITISADGGTMYVFNNKSDPGPNPRKVTSSVAHLDPCPYDVCDFAKAYDANQYVFQLEHSGMLTAPVPGEDALEELTERVARNNGYRSDTGEEDREVMRFLRSKIKHVIYIVKENRTFDQVLGDLNNGSNADPSITIFGRAITPNFHRIAEQFVTLDNFFDPGEVSGNGWPWSTAGRETDWNEKNIPMNYTFAVDRGDAPYDAEGQNNNVSVGYVGKTAAETVAARQAEAGGFDYSANAAQYPGGALNLLPGKADDGAPDGKNGAVQGGYLWSAALRKGLTIRNYGFFSDNSHVGLNPGDPGYSAPVEFPASTGSRQMWTAANELIGHTDIYFRGFDEAYPDTWRLEEFEREFKQFTQPGKELPNLVFLRYMRDHMGAFKQSLAGTGTPEAQQADNDFAVGETLELLAKSKYAKDTLVFVVEDDAQDGGDHVDAHRSTAYVVGPYVKRGKVVSRHYTTVNLIRTIEDVLDLEHLNLNTAYQRPMAAVFDIEQGPHWTYQAVASSVLKGTTLNLANANATGEKPVRFARGPTVSPTHSAQWWADQTKGFDWSSEDRVPADQFNRILWRGLKGDAPYPVARVGEASEAASAAGVGWQDK